MNNQNPPAGGRSRRPHRRHPPIPAPCTTTTATATGRGLGTATACPAQFLDHTATPAATAVGSLAPVIRARCTSPGLARSQPQPTGWPNTAPGGPPAGPKRNRRKLFIIAGAAVVVLVAAFVVVPRVAGGGGGGLSASETVTAYLEALASGNAEEALSYGKVTPANTDFLNDEVLGKQIAKMPITNIRILDDGDELASIGMASVKVAVKFGDQLADSTLRLSKVEETWKIDDAINKIEIMSPSAADETLTIFDKELKKGEAFYVFPGFVDAGSANEYLDVTADSPLLAAGPVCLGPPSNSTMTASMPCPAPWRKRLSPARSPTSSTPQAAPGQTQRVQSCGRHRNLGARRSQRGDHG